MSSAKPSPYPDTSAVTLKTLLTIVSTQEPLRLQKPCEGQQSYCSLQGWFILRELSVTHMHCCPLQCGANLLPEVAYAAKARQACVHCQRERLQACIQGTVQ